MRYDVIGCGEVLFQYHAPVLNRLRQEGLLRVRACFDVNPERARAAAKLLGASSHGTLPDADDVGGADAVFVATPPEHHAGLAELYVARGKHALIEKPFVCTPEEADRLRAAADGGGGRVLVGHMRRLYPSLQIARAFLAAGGLGTVERVEAYEGSRWEWPASSNYVTRSPYGGVLYDTGSHVLDSLLFVLGLDEPAPDRWAEVLDVRRLGDDEPTHDVRARFVLHGAEHGAVLVDFGVSRTEALARALKVHGSDGTLTIPGGFALQPVLTVGGTAFRLDAFVGDRQPTNVMGCFLLEHRTLHAVATNPAARSVLDADRFGFLTRLIEQVVQQ